MAEQHRATAEEWRTAERNTLLIYYSCLLELRDRIEALEAAQPKSDSSLVERVTAAIVGNSEAGVNWKPEARAAIREVAAWMGEHFPHGAGGWAMRLEREAERHC